MVSSFLDWSRRLPLLSLSGDRHNSWVAYPGRIHRTSLARISVSPCLCDSQNGDNKMLSVVSLTRPCDPDPATPHENSCRKFRVMLALTYYSQPFPSLAGSEKGVYQRGSAASAHRVCRRAEPWTPLNSEGRIQIRSGPGGTDTGLCNGVFTMPLILVSWHVLPP